MSRNKAQESKLIQEYFELLKGTKNVDIESLPEFREKKEEIEDYVNVTLASIENSFSQDRAEVEVFFINSLNKLKESYSKALALNEKSFEHSLRKNEENRRNLVIISNALVNKKEEFFFRLVLPKIVDDSKAIAKKVIVNCLDNSSSKSLSAVCCVLLIIVLFSNSQLIWFSLLIFLLIYAPWKTIEVYNFFKNVVVRNSIILEEDFQGLYKLKQDKIAEIKNKHTLKVAEINQGKNAKVEELKLWRKEKILATQNSKDKKIEEIQKLLLEKVDQKRVRLKVLEPRIKEILKSDEKHLLKEGLKRLGIYNPEDIDEDFIAFEQSNILEKSLALFVGTCSDKPSDRIILDSEIDINSGAKQLYIRPEDFFEVVGLDRNKRYGVYEFVGIFFCPNFFSYYRCYWNFIRRTSIDSESCEFLYDTIVSSKLIEKSSLRLKNTDQKRTYRYLLYITLMNGKTICFRIPKDKKEKISSKKKLTQKNSEMGEIAQLIRYLLRQRRIDFQRTKSADINH